MEGLASKLIRIGQRLPEGMRNRLRNHVAAYLFDLPSSRIRAIETRLWGGFSTTALREIDDLLGDQSAGARDRAEAAKLRAIWRAATGDFAAAVEDLGIARAIRSDTRSGGGLGLLEAHFLALMGEGREARALIDTLPPAVAESGSAALIRANSHNPSLAPATGSVSAMRVALDAMTGRAGIAPLAPRDPALPFGIDNITAAEPVSPAVCDARVSVIVPLYNGVDVLATALASLAAQSWTDLEVIIVDDASTDQGTDIAADFCARDPRFRLVRQPENRGSYIARNRALAEATGAYVTTHDADDWSHPEKIRLQVEDLRTAGRLFSLAEQVRTGTDLSFRGPARPGPRLVARNFSSLLAPRELLLRMGGWDAVRIGADSEMLHRLEFIDASGPVAPVLPECPLSFSRTGAESLTATGPTRITTFYHGVRREYYESRRHWHRSLDRSEVLADGIKVPPPSATVPPVIRPVRSEHPAFDLLVTGDLHSEDPRPFLTSPLRAGLLHYPDAVNTAGKPLGRAIREFAYSHDIAIIAPGERVCAETVLVLDPAAFAHAMDDFPRIYSRRLLVCAKTDRADLRAALQLAFGVESTWLIGADAAPGAILARLRSVTAASA